MAVDKDAANQYLEYAVIGKKSQNRELHEMLLAKLLNQAEEMVKEDGIKYHLEELGELFRGIITDGRRRVPPPV